MHSVLRLLSVAAIAACCAHDARAAESYDGCAGTITTIPATITTQGTWCLKSDRSWSYASGTMVTIATNNVTIDCNHFKLGGNGGGEATTAIGIQATERSNITVRNCNLRGLGQGIVISGAGTTVEDNLLDAARVIGISVASDGGIVRRNRVVGTGLATSAISTGIIAGRSTDVVDNLIDGITGVSPVGININVPSQGVVDGNHLRGIVASGAGRGIVVDAGSRLLVRGNHVMYGVIFGDPAPDGSQGIDCNGGPRVTALYNTTSAWPAVPEGGIDCPTHASNSVLF